jgi:hypothetical protein
MPGNCPGSVPHSWFALYRRWSRARSGESEPTMDSSIPVGASASSYRPAQPQGGELNPDVQQSPNAEPLHPGLYQDPAVSAPHEVLAGASGEIVRHAGDALVGIGAGMADELNNPALYRPGRLSIQGTPRHSRHPSQQGLLSMPGAPGTPGQSRHSNTVNRRSAGPLAAFNWNNAELVVHFQTPSNAITPAGSESVDAFEMRGPAWMYGAQTNAESHSRTGSHAGLMPANVSVASSAAQEWLSQRHAPLTDASRNSNRMSWSSRISRHSGAPSQALAASSGRSADPRQPLRRCEPIAHLAR